MGKPRFLVDNLFSTRAYPSHTVEANEAAGGHDAWRVANGRRHGLDYWTPTTANAQAYIGVTCDRVRAADMIALDRGHNLAGHTVRLRVSQDGFSTYREVFAVTLPSAASEGSVLEGGSGVRTEEGAWLYRFDVEAGTSWRLYIDAMGAGLAPRIVGLWLGLSYQPALHADRPWGDDDSEVQYEALVSDAGWEGADRHARVRKGDVGLLLEDDWAYDLARLHLQSRYHDRRRPMWYVPDDEQAERAMLVRAPRGAFGFRWESGWGWRQGRLPYVEHEPARL